MPFHQAAINVFALHPTRDMCVSGDLQGGVFFSSYMTGQPGCLLCTHEGSVESIAFCLNESAPYCITCGMDNLIHIINVKESRLR
jgi:WD40 repeat protein